MADVTRTGTEVVAGGSRSVRSINTRKLVEVETLLNRHDVAISRTFFPILRAISTDKDPTQIEEEKQVHRDALNRMLERSMSESDLNMIASALDDAISAPSNEEVIELSLSALMDTRVNLPNNLPIYLEALIYDLKDAAFSPYVVAAACQRIRRECKFLPAISEVLNMCREIQSHYIHQRQRIKTAISHRRESQIYLAELGD